ncbi:hypothetical protein Dimus_015138 [Dionaea muscipula]
MAAVLGSVALLAEAALPRTSAADRKSRQIQIDIVSTLHRWDFSYSSNFPSKGLEFDGERRIPRVGVRGKVSSKESAIDFFGNSSDEENEDAEEYEEFFDWEAEMRKRVKEMEERRELEEKAEELRGKVEEENRALGIVETEEEKTIRVRKELEKVAKEQAERRGTAKLMFELGQKAYERGVYKRSIEYFEAALTIIPRATMFGGEIQIWLAMAYAANNRQADCINLYTQLEARHPYVSIRRQAADFRYIMQAPKIKINPDEMLTMPSIGSAYDNYATTWTDKWKDADPRSFGSTSSQPSSSRDYVGDLLKWKPLIGLEKNRIFWAALTLWLGLVGVAIVQQR